MSEFALQIKNLSKSFEKDRTQYSSIYETIVSLRGKKSSNRLQIFKDVSFDVKKGEVFGIIGKNGTGKSTLLKIISGIYRADSGSINVDGKISLFLDLSAGIQTELTAKENIILIGMIKGFTKEEITKKIDGILKFAELEDFVDAKLKHFSSGMLARLLFATAIQMKNDIFLIDEIMAVGDQEFQKKSFDAFMELKKEGKTFLIVSHDHDLLKRICDRMILIHGGKMLKIGEPEQVLAEYNNLLGHK